MSKERKQITAATVLTEEANSQRFINTIVKASWIAYLVSALFQVIFYPQITNIIVVLFCGIGWLLYTKIFMRVELWRSFMFSSFLILGFATTHILLPLLFTSMEGKEVIYNLERPEEVFLHSLAVLAVIIVAHAFYRFLAQKTSNRSFSIMESLGFYTAPNDMQLWIMGFIGLGSIYYAFFAAPDVGYSVTGSPFDKLIQSMSSFAYAPYLLICGALYGRKSSKIGSNLIPLALFTAGLLAMAVGRNSTGAFMFGFTSVVFSFVAGSFVGVFDLKIFTLKNFVIGGLLIWLLVGPLADLRTAMVIVRGERTEIPAEVLLQRTIEAYGDKEAIRERREYDNDAGVQDPDWDERYLDNLFTARFANVKFNDLSLDRADLLGMYDPNMLDFAFQYFVGGLPDPVIKFFNFDVDKDAVYSISNGDFLYFTSGGEGPVEAYRVGHFAGIGMATFGWWYLGILGVLMIPVFWLVDKFQQRRKSTSTLAPGEQERLNFSFCGLLAITTFFQFLQLESVIQIAIYLMRGWLQLAVLYLIIFHTTRLLTGSGIKRLKWSTSTT